MTENLKRKTETSKPEQSEGQVVVNFGKTSAKKRTLMTRMGIRRSPTFFMRPLARFLPKSRNAVNLQLMEIFHQYNVRRP